MPITVNPPVPATCRLLLAICSLLLLLLSATAGIAAPSGELLKISGCSISRTGYLDFLTAAFSERTGIRVLLKGGGSVAGLLNLEAEAADLAASCLPPEAESVPPGARMVPVAWDALVFIVHPDNPLNSIKLEQARQIFLGRIGNWQALGGPDLPLTLYLQSAPRAPIQGVPYFIKNSLLKGREITTDPAVLSFRPSGGLVEEAMARNPAGFAATGFASARLKGGKLRMLNVNGVAPSRESIISGAYPAELRRPLYLTIATEPAPVAARFLAFVLSQEGQDLLRSHGVVALDDIPDDTP